MLSLIYHCTYIFTWRTTFVIKRMLFRKCVIRSLSPI